ncbi:helix-turn-helix domain-containing protein [Clostridium sp.]|uniref:helix-turn-helix domain-containing protein n=1 Tax=Clostridium sp. TaxID=1506 RepID=UPI0025C3EEE1|nr:helix-turn-helix domain-containing protein [Clostridium sp.]
MDQNNLGLIIKQLRINKKITQEELASGICSTSQLYRIEKGKHFPSVFLLHQLSEKLAVDITKYIMFLNCTNPVYFSVLFENLEQLRLRRKYNDILSLISEIEMIPQYNYDINLTNIKQLLCWYKGIALTNINDASISIDYYLELLNLTVKYDDTKELFKSILSINEIKIIHSIAATYCRLCEFSIAHDILLSLINNIKIFHVDLDVSLISEIYYNLSKLLFIQKDYENAILYADDGIKNCICNNFSCVLADLFYILGQCHECLGEFDLSIKNFSKFVCLYDILGHDKFSLSCKHELLEKYGEKITKLE